MKLFYKAIDNYDRERYQYLNLDLIDVLYFRINEETEDYQINVNGVFHNVDYDTFKKIKQCFQELAQEDEEDRKDLKDIKIAEERLVDNNCKGRFFTLEEVKAKLGLDTSYKEHENIRLTRQRSDTANNQNNHVSETDIRTMINAERKKIETEIESLLHRHAAYTNPYMSQMNFRKFKQLIQRTIIMEKDNIISKLQSNPWDPRKAEYNEKGELVSVTIEFKEDEQDDQEKED